MLTYLLYFETALSVEKMMGSWNQFFMVLQRVALSGYGLSVAHSSFYSVQHPKVMSAVAKALVTKPEAAPSARQNRVGQIVRFPNFGRSVEEARKTAGESRQPIYSTGFKLSLPRTAGAEWRTNPDLEW